MPFVHGHQGMEQFLIGAGHYREHGRLVATFGGQIGMAHAGVDVDRLADLKRHRVIMFGVDRYPAA